VFRLPAVGEPTHLSAVHVDDMIARGKDISDKLLELGHKVGKLEHVGPSGHKFLGVIYKFVRSGIVLNMQEYCSTSLPSPVTRRVPPTPMPLDVCLESIGAASDSALNELESKSYGSILGKLQWISVCLRFDILYGVQFLKRFTRSPTVYTMSLLDRLLAYVVSTKELELVIPPPSKGHYLVGYSDSTWAHMREKYRSQSGWIIGIEGIDVSGKLVFSPIHWASRTQRRVAKSSTTAEALSLLDMVEAMMYMQEGMRDMGISLRVVAKVDSKDSSDLLRAGTYVNPRDKSLILTVHVLREYINSGRVELVKIPREVNYADELVKPTKGTLIRSLFK